MKKNSKLGYIILGIVFVLFNVIAFAVPSLKTGAFWIAYGFSVAAFAIQVGVWKAALGKEASLKSKFLGFPIVHIGIVYLILQLIAFAVFMAVPTLPSWSAIVVCALILGISAICMISVDAGRGEIERVEAKVKEKVFFIKSLQIDVEMLASNESDAGAKAELQKLAEKIRFSDPMSNEALANLEGQILEKVGQLKTAEDKAAVIAEIDSLLTERNLKAKLLK